MPRVRTPARSLAFSSLGCTLDQSGMAVGQVPLQSIGLRMLQPILLHMFLNTTRTL